MTALVHPMADPVGLAPPTPYQTVLGTDDPYYQAYGPGTHVFNYSLEMDQAGEWLVQSSASPPLVINAEGNYREIGELHLYHRVGAQWRHTFAQTGITYGGPALALRFSPDGKWLIVVRRGQATVINAADGSFDPADYRASQRLQVWRRDGDQLVLHGYGPPDVFTDFAYANALGFALDFDPTGKYVAMSGFYGFTGLLGFDDGALTALSGRSFDESYLLGHTYAEYFAELGNSFLLNAWNPADPTLVLRIDLNSQVQLFKRNGTQLDFVSFFGTTASIYPAWHRSGTIVALVQPGDCGQLVRNFYSYPDAELLGTLLVDFGAQQVDHGHRNFFDRSGQYISWPLTYSSGDAAGNQILDPFRVAAFTAGGHPVDGGYPSPYSGYELLAEVPAPDRAAGPVAAWGCDPGGGGRYLVVPCEDVLQGIGLSGANLPDDFASRWGFRTYRIDGDGAGCPGGAGPVVTSVLRERQPDGTQQVIGVEGHPAAMFTPDGSLRTWPTSTAPLLQMQPDGSWRTVIGVDAR